MRNKPKLIRGKLKDKIIYDIWALFERKKEKDERKKKNHTGRTNKDIIIRDKMFIC